MVAGHVHKEIVIMHQKWTSPGVWEIWAAIRDWSSSQNQISAIFWHRSQRKLSWVSFVWIYMLGYTTGMIPRVAMPIMYPGKYLCNTRHTSTRAPRPILSTFSVTCSPSCTRHKQNFPHSLLLETKNISVWKPIQSWFGNCQWWKSKPQDWINVSNG